MEDKIQIEGGYEHNLLPEPIAIEKPDGMSNTAQVEFDKMTKVKKEKHIPKTIQTRMNILENKLNAKMKTVLKGRRRNAKSKKSRKKNRKK